jgi:hypothetical protein
VGLKQEDSCRTFEARIFWRSIALTEPVASGRERLARRR